MFVIDRGVPAAPAKRICMTCKVQPECDQFAVDNGLMGVFGGRVHKGYKVAKDKRVQEVTVVVELTDIRPQKSAG